MGACFSAYDEYEADANRGNALAAMLKVEGFDVIIICCGTSHQAAFWQARLERGRGVIVPQDATVLCVHEDWPGGAGNGLGTLYAWTKAAKLAEDKGDSQLASKLASGSISAALYHTAGKGTRLAPLPGAENNNKPGVKLPATAPLGVDGAVVPLTILESVVKSTGIYASSRKGRLSVFWGDQVFVPTKSYEYDAKRAHADILCMLAPMPSASEWAAKGLEKYGLVAVAKNGNGAASFHVPGRVDGVFMVARASTRLASGSGTLTGTPSTRSGDNATHSERRENTTITTQARPARSRRSTTRPPSR